MRQISEQLALRTQGSVDAEFGRVWTLHLADFPEDQGIVDREYEVDPEITRYKQSELLGLTVEGLNRMLLVRNDLIVARAVTETNLRLDFWRTKEAEVRSLQSYLVDLVGPLAMKEVLRESWARKNPELKTLRSSFENREILELALKRQVDRRLGRDLGKTSMLALLAPGYRFKRQLRG